MLWIAGFAALGVGVLLGLLGAGGSTLTVPLLVYLVGLAPKEAMATSLAIVALTSLLGLALHARHGHVAWRVGLSFGGVAMLGAYAGGRLSAHVPDAWLMALFGALMLATALALLRREEAPRERVAPIKTLRVLLLGAVVGSVTGLLGAGGGFLVVPVLSMFGALDMRRAVGTSLLVVAMNATAGLGGYAEHVPLDLWVVVALVVPAAAGMLVGAAWMRRTSPRSLRRRFAAVIAVAGALVLAQQLPSDTVAALGAPAWPLWFGALLLSFVALTAERPRARFVKELRALRQRLEMSRRGPVSPAELERWIARAAVRSRRAMPGPSTRSGRPWSASRTS